MTDTQLYFAISIPCFAVFMGTMVNLIVIVWQARGIERRIDSTDMRMDSFDKRMDSFEKRMDRIERVLDVIQSDLKEFYKAIAKINAKIGID